YFLTATLRADQSTRFGQEYKTGLFPSATIAWRLSEEGFIPAEIAELKVRLGYGIAGNQDIVSPPHKGNYFMPLQINNDGAVTTPVLKNSMQNKNIRWEQTNHLNAGIDFNFAKGKIT